MTPKFKEVTIFKVGDREGTTKKLCDNDFAERSGELSGAICLETLVLLGNAPNAPANFSEKFKLFGAVRAIYWALWVLLGSCKCNIRVYVPVFSCVAGETKVSTSTAAALFSKMALTGQRIAMVDMVSHFLQHFHVYRRGGWSQSLPLKIFFSCSLGGGGGRYFSVPSVGPLNLRLEITLEDF